MLIHEAGGALATDVAAAVAAAEWQASAAAAAAGTVDSQLGAPAPAARPSLYMLAAGKGAAEVAELSVRPSMPAKTASPRCS